MITVSILINGRPIYTRTATNTLKQGKDGTVYKVDDGNRIEHTKEDGAISLAKKMLDLIDPAINTNRQDAKSVADTDAEKARAQALADMGDTFADSKGADADINEDVESGKLAVRGITERHCEACGKRWVTAERGFNIHRAHQPSQRVECQTPKRPPNPNHQKSVVFLVF